VDIPALSSKARQDATCARTPARALLGSALIFACLALAALASSAQAAFGVEEHNFEAGTCNVTSCTYASIEANHAEAFTQSAGHPPWGITAFELNHKNGLLGEEPEGALKRLRVDVPPGLAANPEALPKCSRADFESDKCAANTQVGSDELTIYLAGNLTITGTVYNLEQPAGLPLSFGIHVEVPLVVNEHIYLEGHVDYAGDYHEYFEINNISKAIPILRSKLLFNGQAGIGNFLTLPSPCASTTVSHLEVESYEGQISRTQTKSPRGIEHCDRVPFNPTAEVKPETSASDQPDGASTEIKAPQNPTSTNTADVKDVHVLLPEGLTLNAPAAHGLTACSEAQRVVGGCPASSKIGTVVIETDLPPGTLAGSVYLGSPSGATITDPPFNVYIDAESVYGVSVRLKGLVSPDPNTGRLQVTFLENPPLPFSDLVLKLNGGSRAPLANPLVCGTAQTQALFTPYTGLAPATSSTPFATGACSSPLQFAIGQSTQNTSGAAGAYTSFVFNLARQQGQQYLSQLSAVLPPGLVGAIPSLTPCPEPQASTGACSSASLIGTASVAVGSGGEPYGFGGPVYLTGPYNGAPYGLSIPIEAAAGPFDLGPVVTRASINVDTYSGRILVTSTLPQIVKGIPLRLRNLTVLVDRHDFLFNPSSCDRLSTDTLFNSTFGAAGKASSPFQVGKCSALPFKPTFAAATNSKTKKVTGAGLQVSMTQGSHQANLRSVVVQLPKQLPSRLSTLQKACPEAAYAANPRSCPSGSLVGTVRVSTPVLPQPLSGPAYLVSHGGAAFPDLDLLLEGDGGVRVILVGNTNITKGTTTSTFASIPDVPVSNFSLSLPMGSNSALAAYGDFCAKPLLMPTTITAQNGAVVKQNTSLSIANCGVKIIRRRISRHTLILTVRSFAAGRISVSGRTLRTVHHRVSGPTTVNVRVPLERAALARLGSGGGLRVRVRVAFLPRSRGEARSTALASVLFRH
jgi:hypothetical protein